MKGSAEVVDMFKCLFFFTSPPLLKMKCKRLTFGDGHAHIKSESRARIGGWGVGVMTGLSGPSLLYQSGKVMNI